MDSSVSQKDKIWFVRVCHHISTGSYDRMNVGSADTHILDWSSWPRCRSWEIGYSFPDLVYQIYHVPAFSLSNFVFQIHHFPYQTLCIRYIIFPIKLCVSDTPFSVSNFVYQIHHFPYETLCIGYTNSSFNKLSVNEFSFEVLYKLISHAKSNLRITTGESSLVDTQ